MNILVLKKFNNYFNRLVRKFDTLAEYRAASSEYIDLSGINFNPADGVTTELILGKGQIGGFFDFEKTDAADYLICYTVGGTEEDPTYTIESRWFITELDRTRGGQYRFLLKRDSIVDNFDSLQNCPAYIMKGTVQDNDPYILNDEGMQFNEIKSDEQLLKDKTNSAWIVGYYAKETTLDETIIQANALDIGKYLTLEDLQDLLGLPQSFLTDLVQGNLPGFAYLGNKTFTAYNNWKDNTKREQKFWATLNSDLSVVVDKNYKDIHDSSVPAKAIMASKQSLSQLYILWDTCVKFSELLLQYNGSIEAEWESFFGEKHYFLNDTGWNTLNDIVNNKVIIEYGGKYYHLVFDSVNSASKTVEPSSNLFPFSTVTGQLCNYTASLCRPDIGFEDHHTTGKIAITTNETEFMCHLELITDLNEIPGVSFEMSANRNPCLDQVYDMFILPFSEVKVKYGAQTYFCSGDYSQRLAQYFAVKNDKAVYDVQLLPYFPIPELIDENGVINLNSLELNLREHYDYDWVISSDTKVKETIEGPVYGIHEAVSDILHIPGKHLSDIEDYGYYIISGAEYIDGEGVPTLEEIDTAPPLAHWETRLQYTFQLTEEGKSHIDDIQVGIWWIRETGTTNIKKESIVFYPKKASFSTLLDKTLALKDEMKVESQCNKYRICSPNYQGSFDFNVAKNGGSVSNFIADCTYKPYTPYIKVAPAFNWMYGTNYGDARGLICGGDFSLSRVSDAWEQYELNNKNYQNIFNRDIQNLDINQNIAYKQQEIVGGIGIAQAGISGAVAGGMVGSAGGPWGAAIGAAVGGTVGAVSSAIGYAKDLEFLKQQQYETKQYAIDRFNYSIANIKAIPYTLTKVSAFTINSKIWPFLEYYTCTDEEKKALREKIKYDGMTVMRIEPLGNYLGNEGYLKATLIRNTEITDDHHILVDINNELNKGVYL